MNDDYGGSLSIDVQGLTKRYKGGKIANDNLTLQVQRGQIFGLLGPNGAGKTTLVLQLLGLLAPTWGEIILEGVDVVRHPDRVKTFSSLMPQTRVAMRNLEVWRALYITGRLRGQDAGQARRQTETLLDRLDLGKERDTYLDRLSGGMMRVASFAMALMGDPRVIVLDEPTNELDPVRRRVVWDMVADLNREQRVTCLLVTHNVLEAERVIERVAMIDGGRVVAVGTPGELKNRLSDEVRLEIVLKPEAVRSSHLTSAVSRLQCFGSVIALRPGQYAMFVPRERVGDAVNEILGGLEDTLDDFRLAPPSLEDVYIHLAGQKLESEEVSVEQALDGVPIPIRRASAGGARLASGYDLLH